MLDVSRLLLLTG